ncbi:endonuclease domain-containing protein [Angustibacter speluncae]
MSKTSDLLLPAVFLGREAVAEGVLTPKQLRRDHDVVAVRRAFGLVDPRAESLPESAVRVHLVLAGFDPTPQYVIRVRGRVVARVDLALVEHRVAVEYDGAWHALREQLERDRARLNHLREAGWVVVHVTADLLRRPADVVAAVRRAVGGAAANSGRSAPGRASRTATT